MLYAKIDDAGNPVEVAKNYLQIKDDFFRKNTIIPVESVFSEICSSIGYAEVPASDPPAPQAGKKIVPDIPVKTSDGNYQRTWKYVTASSEEISQTSTEMKLRRQRLLRDLIDTISPIRWESWSAEEQAEIKAWRQEMLDITEKEGWPFLAFPPLPSSLKS